jgi:predicted nucleic acid-binding Zn ribbon protein
MGLLGTVTEVFKASTESGHRGDVTETESVGAYWCHDCGERIRDVDVEGELADDESPDCPDCGDPMEFERSKSTTGCAC